MTCGFLIQLVFCIKICLRQQSVTPFLSGATPPEKKSWICPWLRLSVLPATLQVRETNKKLFPVYIWTNSNTSLTYKHSIGFETKDTVTLTKDQWAGISPGHYKHDPLCYFERKQRNKEHIAWENSPHLVTLPLASPPNDVWEKSTEIPYWWRITTQKG